MFALISCGLVLVPISEYAWLILSGGPPHWLHGYNWIVDCVWLVSGIAGLISGVRACGLADRRADGLAIFATLLNFISLLTLGLLTIITIG
jgi:hypothetical protein